MPVERALPLPLDVMRQLYQLAIPDDPAVAAEVSLNDALAPLPYKRWFGPGQFGSGPGRSGRGSKPADASVKP